MLLRSDDGSVEVRRLFWAARSLRFAILPIFLGKGPTRSFVNTNLTTEGGSKYTHTHAHAHTHVV